MTPADRVPAPLLVLGGVVSVQFGGALAAQLIPQIGPGGAVLLRVAFAAAALLVVLRPRVRGHGRTAWLVAAGFGVALGLMNWSFYGSLAHLPLGVAVTVEFCGPLVLATVMSHRALDLLAVVAAGVGVVLVSQALARPLGELSWTGLLLAGSAGACWAAYILLSRETGRHFAGVDGLAFALVVATVVVLPAGIRHAGDWTPGQVLRGAALAVLSSLLPYSFELLALRRLPPRAFGILLSLEPAVAALAGFVVLGQQLSGPQWVGLGLVVLASGSVAGTGGPAPTD